MRAASVIGIAWRDLVNLRSTHEIAAGLATIAIATTISILSISFSRSALDLLVKAMEPTKTVASIVDIYPKAGLFTRKEYADLNERLSSRDLSDLISNRANIIRAIDGDVFRLLNSSGTTSRMQDVTIWSVPPTSFFLKSENGINYVDGATFESRATLNGIAEKPQPDSPRVRGKAPEGTDANVLRLGVIVNSKYIEKYNNISKSELEERIEKGLSFPYISIEFNLEERFRKNRDGGERVNLNITGIIDEPSYPDLIFTEDLAKLYYFDAEVGEKGGTPKAAFYGYYASKLAQWETGEPLINLEGAQTNVYWPNKRSDFEYVSLRNAGYEPYDQVRIQVKDWQTEGARERLRELVQRSESLPKLQGERSKRLAFFAANAVKLDLGLDGGVFPDQAREQIRKLLVEESILKEVSKSFVFEEIGGEFAAYRLNDQNSGSYLEIRFSADLALASITRQPAWSVQLRAARLTTALVRLQNVVKAYASVMFAVVLLLASSASLLFAFAHVLRKTRDVGLLLANGASAPEVFCIYLLQIAIVAVAGWLLGIIFSIGAAPAMNEFAVQALEQFLRAAEVGDAISGGGSVLEPNAKDFLKSFAWVVPASLFGAVYPVYRASVLDPLSSLSRGA